jgi:hypothetical protein
VLPLSLRPDLGPERIGAQVRFQRSRTGRSKPQELRSSSSVIRLVGAVVADMHDEWQSGERHYLSEGSMVRLKPASATGGHRRHRQRRVDTPVPDRATGQLTGHR